MPSLKRFLPRNREARLALAFLAVGLIGLPVLIYVIGALTLGAADTGFWTYMKSLYGSLLQLRPSAWGLVLGPYVLFTVLRFTSRPLRVRGR